MLYIFIVLPAVRPVMVTVPDVGFGKVENEALLTLSLPTAGATVTTQDPDILLPSTEVALIVTEPADNGATVPDEETIAMDSSLLLHVTFLFVASAGVMFAVSAPLFPPTVSESVCGTIATPVTAIVEGEAAAIVNV